MAISKKYALALAVIGAIATACNSGGNSNNDKKTPAGFKHTGVITGFGSVYVNGVKYETDTAEAEDGGICTTSMPMTCSVPVTVEGQKGSMDDLDIGILRPREEIVPARRTVGNQQHHFAREQLFEHPPRAEHRPGAGRALHVEGDLRLEFRDPGHDGRC